MKKTAKTTQSKRTRERKLIEIKQSKHISPVKQVTQPQDSRIMIKKQKAQKIPPLTKQQYQFTNPEMESISSQADALVSLQLIKKIIQRQHTGLQDSFLAISPSIMKKALGRAIKNVHSNLNIIREQRVQRMKQETVIFIPPDRDNFQKRKGKILNNWMKQQLQVHEQKNKFGKTSQNYMQIFKNAQQRITNLSSNVPRQKIQPDLQRIATQINKKNSNELQQKISDVCIQIKDILKVSDQMRRTRTKVMKEREKNSMIKQLAICKFSRERIPTHSMLLYGVQDYFF